MLLQLHEVHKQVKLGKYSFEKHPNVPGVTGSLDLVFSVSVLSFSSVQPLVGFLDICLFFFCLSKSTSWELPSVCRLKLCCAKNKLY